MFLGPEGFKMVNRQGGTPQEVYPMHKEFYFEGIFEKQWEKQKNKVERNISEVPTFVSYNTMSFLILIYIIYIDFWAGPYRPCNVSSGLPR